MRSNDVKIRIEITGARAVGKTHMANRIADLIESEAFGCEYEIVSAPAEGARTTIERSGVGKTPPR